MFRGREKGVCKGKEEGGQRVGDLYEEEEVSGWDDSMKSVAAGPS